MTPPPDSVPPTDPRYAFYRASCQAPLGKTCLTGLALTFLKIAPFVGVTSFQGGHPIPAP